MTNSDGTRNFLAKIILLSLALLLTGGCVYFNTFYLAKKWYKQAETSRKKADRDMAAGGEVKLYQDAIKKCSKVLSEHPGSGYTDDALFMIGKAFYYLQDYPKAERKFRELLSSFPNSSHAEESRFFLAKSRYQMDNYVLARESFVEFIDKEKKSNWRSEATYLMGDMSLKQFDTTSALDYYNQFVTEFKSDKKTPTIQFQIGQLQFESKHYEEALESFTKAAQMSESDSARFLVMYQEGMALYALDSIQAGLALFKKLSQLQKDSTNLGNILLRIAEAGFKIGDERETILMFDDIATTWANKVQAAEAYYCLGLRVQDVWGDLELAKILFDQTAFIPAGGQWRQLAIERAANITRVEQYRSGLSQDKEDEAVESRFLLAEMYRTTMNLPDSALSEYASIVANFPDSKLAPKALLVIGWLSQNYLKDTVAAHNSYQRVIDKYPQSDEYGDAIRQLGVNTSLIDTIYAEKLYNMAEDQLFDQNNSDSATALFQRLVNEFPDSKFAPQSEFAIAKMQLAKFVPETRDDDSTFVDSTMIVVFKQIADKYPLDPIGVEAARLASGEGRPIPQKKPEQNPAQTDSLNAEQDSTLLAAEKDTLSESEREELNLKQEQETTPLITFQVPTVKGEFTYPMNAAGTKFQGKLVLKIKIEQLDGRVTDIIFLKGSHIPDIDREVKRAMLETYFDPLQFKPLEIGGYFIYNYDVTLPEIYK